jgi:phosphoacetylglucosamine mutase
LQDDIDRISASVINGRAFVRPSGTEDILRLYAEAATKEEYEKMAEEILQVI